MRFVRRFFTARRDLMAIDLSKPLAWLAASHEEQQMLRDLQGNILKGHTAGRRRRTSSSSSIRPRRRPRVAPCARSRTSMSRAPTSSCGRRSASTTAAHRATRSSRRCFDASVGPKLPTGGVGLLFMAFNSSLTQFVFTQKSWANDLAFPPANVGIDPIIGQGFVTGTTPKPKWHETWDEPASTNQTFDFHGSSPRASAS